ncbi:MAG: hypothetical protein AAB839_02660 [Patescibacteria group bacterium]
MPRPRKTSHVSDQQIVDAARRYYVDDIGQAVLARELGISASYLSRRFRLAKASGLITVGVETALSSDIIAADAIRHEHGQSALVVNGSVVLASIDTRSATPATQQVTIDGTTVTLVVTRT